MRKPTTDKHIKVKRSAVTCLLLLLILTMLPTCIISCYHFSPPAWQESHELTGGWCWFQDPRAVRRAGIYDKTYLAWIANNGDVKISSYDHKSREIDVFTLHTTLEVDDHAAPAILVRNDGRLIVFYTHHCDCDIRYRISTNAEDVSSWRSEQILAFNGQVCYPNPIQLTGENNNIYLFFRGGVSGNAINVWSYVTSTDGGVNWSSATRLIEIGTNIGNHQYLKMIPEATSGTENLDTIYFFHSGHPDNETTSIYFFYYRNNVLYRASGTKICDVPTDLPIDRADMDLVYDATGTGHYKAWIWDAALDGDKPVAVFATFPSTADHRYNYVRWTGNSWDEHEITAAGTYLSAGQPYYSGGISLDKEAPNTAYLSKQVLDEWEIQKWRTSDGGATWEIPVTITASSLKGNIRPVVVRNHHSDLIVFWMHGDYASYTNFNTAIKHFP